MAWFDILGGLAKGANQGIGELRQDLQLRKENALKEAAEKRFLGEQKNRDAAEARAAEADIERQIAEFIDRSDPNNLDAAEVQKFGGIAQRYIQKTADGRLVPRESPLKVQKRAYDTMVLDDAPAELAAKRQTRELGTTKAASALAAQRVWDNPTQFMALNDRDKLRIAQTVGADMQTVIPMLTPAGQAAYRNNTSAAIAANAQGAWNVKAAEAAGARNAADNKTAVRVAEIRAAQAGSAAQQQAILRLVGSIMSEEGIDAAAAMQKATALLGAAPAAAGGASRFLVEPIDE